MELTTRSQITIQQNTNAFQGAKQQGHKEQGCKRRQTTENLVSRHTYTGDSYDQTAINPIKKVLKIAREEGHKLWETIAYHELEHAYTSDNQNETEIPQYMQIKGKEGYKLLETVAYFPEATSCLFLTSVCSKECDYEKAKRLYEKVLNILGTEPNHQFLRDKTLGFGVILFSFEDTDKTVKSIYQVKTSIAKRDTKTDLCEDNYGATANVFDKAQLQDTLHETADNVDRIHSKNPCFSHDRNECKEQILLRHFHADGGKSEDSIKTYKIAAPIVDETKLKDSNATKNTHKKASERHQKEHKIPVDLKADEIEVIEYRWSDYNQLPTGQRQESIKCYSHGVKFAITPGGFESTPDKPLEREVYTNLGHAYYKSFMFGAALESYRKVEEILKDIGESKEKSNLCVMLGHTFRQLKQNEMAIEYYQKALGINEMLKNKSMHGNRNKKSLEMIINEWCGYCCSFIDGKYDEAITFYKKAKEIAKQDKEKYQEYCINQAIGNIFWNTGNFKKAKNYYQESLENAKEIGDKGCEGRSHLNLASVCSKEFDYQLARKMYEEALFIFRSEHLDSNLKEKALVGLGIACFNLGHIHEATKYIGEAIAAKETEKGGINVENTQQILDDAEQTVSSS